MKKLTKKQRHEIYKNALNELIRFKDTAKWNYGICHFIQQVSGYNKDKAPCAYEDRAFGYPEFDLFFENEGDAFFYFYETIDYHLYNLFEIRQLILMFCIEMTR